MRIGFLGPEGTFSQEALEVYAKGKTGVEEVKFETILDLLYAADTESIDEAIVPIENSIEGAVNATLDLLAGEFELKIKNELVMKIRQNLLVNGSAMKEDIDIIISHPQAIGQCRQYLHKEFPGAAIKYVYSTAGAAEEVASLKNINCAAIGSKKAAEIFGLKILKAGIQDDSNNCTRFVVVSKHDSEKTGNDKTSLVFSTEDKPGSLYRILEIFNLWDINMTRIESRPAKNELGRYIFFIDISGHCSDQNVSDALTMIKRKVSFYKFLGSYPASKEII